ncbi:hypothetical protein QQ045_011707 [Rhodiola kirilowii]
MLQTLQPPEAKRTKHAALKKKDGLATTDDMVEEGKQGKTMGRSEGRGVGEANGRGRKSAHGAAGEVDAGGKQRRIFKVVLENLRWRRWREESGRGTSAGGIIGIGKGGGWGVVGSEEAEEEDNDEEESEDEDEDLGSFAYVAAHRHFSWNQSIRDRQKKYQCMEFRVWGALLVGSASFARERATQSENESSV